MGKLVPLRGGMASLAARINAEHEACEAAYESALEHAHRAGQLLIEAKRQLPHGAWLPWLAEHFTGAERTAQTYMRVARELPGGDPQRAADLSVRAVVRELTAERKRRERSARIEQPIPLAEVVHGAYGVILADPPWPMDHLPLPSRAVENHYPTLAVEDIKALPVPAADDALLFLWTTNARLPDAFDVVAAWGFDYAGNFTWDKGRLGLGYFIRYEHELVLLGRRGEVRPPVEAARPRSILREQAGRHSAKPAALHELIERAFPDARKLELFARSARPGWTAWGNEVAA